MIAATRGLRAVGARGGRCSAPARRWSTRRCWRSIGDVAHPAWRASAVGVYRLWRDAGFAVGALLAGVIADRFGMPAAIWAVAALTGASGLVVLVRMYETHPAESRRPPREPPSRPRGRDQSATRTDASQSEVDGRATIGPRSEGEPCHRRSTTSSRRLARELDRLDPIAAREAAASGALIVDTRCAEARRASGVIPGSVHVPLSVLYWRLDRTSGHADETLADRDRQFILVCADGYSSSLAAATLRDLGLLAGDRPRRRLQRLGRGRHARRTARAHRRSPRGRPTAGVRSLPRSRRPTSR